MPSDRHFKQYLIRPHDQHFDWAVDLLVSSHDQGQVYRDAIVDYLQPIEKVSSEPVKDGFWLRYQNRFNTNIVIKIENGKRSISFNQTG